MSKKDKKAEQTAPEQQEPMEETQAQAETQAGQPESEAKTEAQSESADPLLTELESLKDQVAQQEDKYLRLAAEYDNYRRRTAKEKDSIWNDAKADAAVAFLPVYDNLERALKQETADEAFKKGVEMTMTQLKTVLEKLGITEIPALGQTFDPNLHNAVMHVEDENFGENTVCDVFQAGFQLGDKVIRFAMVKVAN
ncbi:nucleotide exchange factor GrpE [Pseudoflavonifractor phocaeensis]|uniref:nucleotide exchange factor GrpE n=2 Tax=Eubacteriales TaxID=186802 RepID=UPI0025A34A4A|nr:nucleotide exchange factor GrpE [Pseudoflavonifractor phocaeensis]MDM8239090.1 nucleotide exchange factor GrpE [Pseudoflavonifractor phocaeensis]